MLKRCINNCLSRPRLVGWICWRPRARASRRSDIESQTELISQEDTPILPPAVNSGSASSISTTRSIEPLPVVPKVDRANERCTARPINASKEISALIAQLSSDNLHIELFEESTSEWNQSLQINGRWISGKTRRMELNNISFVLDIRNILSSSRIWDNIPSTKCTMTIAAQNPFSVLYCIS